jgi:secreted protein with Ig-like and vWFA domain
MEPQQTVMLPNDPLFTSDGRNFMVSLPMEVADGSGMINLPILFTTEGSSAGELEGQPASGSDGDNQGFVLKRLNTDSKNSFFLDTSQVGGNNT